MEFLQTMKRHARAAMHHLLDRPVRWMRQSLALCARHSQPLRVTLALRGIGQPSKLFLTIGFRATCGGTTSATAVT